VTPKPWDPDGTLGAEAARTRIAAAFPALRGRDVRYFDEGFDYLLFEVDRTWLFRFPKLEACAQRLDREVELLRRLDGRLPVAVPRYEMRAAGFAGYRRLEGEPLRLSAARPAFAPGFAAFASALHTLPVEEFEAISLPGQDDEVGLEASRAALATRLDEIHSRLAAEVGAKCRDVLAVEPPAAAGAIRLVHGDLGPEHLLTDSEGALVAVIDWGDALLSDPALDLAVGYFAGGERLFDEVLLHYTGGIDTGLPARARLVALYMAVGCITFGTRLGRPTAVRTGLAALEQIGSGGGP